MQIQLYKQSQEACGTMCSLPRSSLRLCVNMLIILKTPPNINEYWCLRLIFRQQIFAFVGVDTWRTCDRVWQYLLGIVLSSGARWCLVSNYNHCLVSPTSCSSANADCCHQRLQRQPATYVRDWRNSAIWNRRYSPYKLMISVHRSKALCWGS